MADILYNHQTYLIAYGEALYPSEALFPSEDLFPSEEFTIYDKFESGSISVSEIIADGNIEFGVPMANKFECRLYDEVDIGQEDIDVYQVIDGISTPIFSGKVDSAKLDKSGTYRTIIAYDYLYWYSTINVADWWESFWENKETATLKELRTSLVTYVGMTEPNVTLVNDSMVCKKSVSITNIAFKDMFKMILELSGVFPNINRIGVLEYITLGNTTQDISDEYETNNSEFQAYTTGNITGIHFTDSNGESKRLIGEDFNAYTIPSNILTFELSTEELDTVGTNLLNVVSGITYTPADINMIVSNLDYKLGDKVETEQGETYILEQTYSGVQLVEQNIIAQGNELLPQVEKSADLNMTLLGERIGRVSQTLESFEVEYADFAEGTEAHFEITDQSITSEVTRATNAEENLSSRIEQTAESITSTVAGYQTIWDEANYIIPWKEYGIVESIQVEHNSSNYPIIYDYYLDVERGLLYRIATVTKDTEASDEDYDYYDITLASNPIQLETTRQAVSSEIEQTATSIRSEVSTADDALSSRIEQTLKSITLAVEDNGTEAGIYITTQKEDGTSSGRTKVGTITLAGLVRFTNLSTAGQTTINGANIQTGTLSADKITTGTMSCDRLNGGAINGQNIIGGLISGAAIQGTLVLRNALGDTPVVYVDDEGTAIPVCLVINGSAFSAGTKVYGALQLVDNSLFLSSRGISGIYSPHILNYLVREFLVGNAFYNAFANNSQGTRIYGSSIWANTSITTGSDERIKDNYKSLDELEEMFFALEPCSYTFKHKKDGIRHVGFKAQNVESAINNSGLKSEDYAFVEINNPDVEIQEYITDGKFLTLRYDEFMALNTHMIQKQQQEINNLKDELATLKEQVSKLLKGE